MNPTITIKFRDAHFQNWSEPQVIALKTGTGSATLLQTGRFIGRQIDIAINSDKKVMLKNITEFYREMNG